MDAVSPGGVVIFVTTWLVAAQALGLGNTVGYHRLLTHRSFKARPAVRVVLTLLGAAHSGSPMVWVGLHRLHHTKSDGEGDPHSPVVHGFWWAHAGWLIGAKSPFLSVPFAVSGFGQQAYLLVHDLRRIAGRNPPTWRSLTPDLEKERLMRWLDVPLVMPALFAAQVAAAWAVAGAWGLAWLWALHLFLTNASWSVNSVAHSRAFGTQPYDNGDQSRDVAWLAWLTNGEGFHNSHHRFPKSARHGLAGGADLSWTVIRALERVGLASEVWLPRAFR